MQIILLCMQLLSGQFSHSLSFRAVSGCYNCLEQIRPVLRIPGYSLLRSKNYFTAAGRKPPFSLTLAVCSVQWLWAMQRNTSLLHFFPGKIQITLEKTALCITVLCSSLLRPSHMWRTQPQVGSHFPKINQQDSFRARDNGCPDAEGWNCGFAQQQQHRN